MILENPWGLLALASVAAVIAIHLFQRRFLRRRVAGLFLWLEGRREAPAGKAVKPPPPTASLLLEILACVVLSLLLAGARSKRAARSEHIAVVLDGSGSMSAKPPGGASFADRAREKVNELFRSSPGARTTIYASGRTPRILFGPEGDPREALVRLAAWRPEEPSHDILETVHLARTAAGGGAPVFVVSDHLPEAVPKGVSWTSVGESLPNVGFVRATRRRKDDDDDDVRLTVRSFGGPAEADLVVREGDREVFRKTIAIDGEADVEIAVPRAARVLAAELPPDALALDDRAFLAPPRLKEVRCLVLASGKEREAIERAARSVEGVALVESPPADLAAGAGTEVLREPPETWVCAFAPFPEGVVSGEPKGLLGPYVVDARHPLFESASLEGVAWFASGNLEVASLPLVSSGEIALVAEAPAPRRGFLFNLDLARTNLTRTPAWPVLLYNLVALRRETLPGPDRAILGAGEPLRLRLPPVGARTVEFEGDGWSESVAAADEVFVRLPSRPMPIRVAAGGEDLWELAVNWHDPAESDLSALGPGRAGESERAETREAAESRWSDPLFWTLLALAAAALLADWSLARRGGTP